jgi:hypothetical protein
MAITKTIEIDVDELKAIGGLENLAKTFKEVDKVTEKSIENIDKVGESAKKQSKTMKLLESSVKAVGTSLKALGIGLVIAVVAKLTEVLSTNQKVVDTFNNVSTAAGIIINQLIDSFTKIYDKISEATGGFNALGEVVGSIAKGVFNNLKLVVYELQIGFYGLKLAYESVFGDDEGVKEAQKNLTELGGKVKDTLKDQVKQAKNVYNNIGEAVTEVVDGVTILATEGTKAISEIDVKSAYSQAESLNRSKKNFELLALQQARLQLKYQNQAELQRQIRDDDTKGINERIKANDELAKILDKQFEAESNTIKQRINSLQQEQKLLGFTQERSNEIYQLQTDLIDVEERLNGARSEQLTNTNSLLKEQKDLIQSQVDTQNEFAIKNKEFAAEQEKTELGKLEKQKELIALQAELDLAELERKKLLYAEGTQARVDAENEYVLKKQETDQALITNQQATNEQLKKDEQALADAKAAIQNANLDNVTAGIGVLKGLFEKNKAVQKGLLLAESAAGIAKTIINTQVGNAKTIAQVGLPAAAPLVAANNIASAISIAATIAATAKGLAALGGGGASGGGASAGGGTPTPAPSFNVVGNSGVNQIAQTLGNQQPMQAYVVANNVTTQQSLDRNIVNNASLG